MLLKKIAKKLRKFVWAVRPLDHRLLCGLKKLFLDGAVRVLAYKRVIFQIKLLIFNKNE